MILLSGYLLAASTSIDPASLGQYGVLGLLAGALAVFARQAYKREAERADRLEGEVTRLNQVIQDKHIPALEAATHAVAEANDLLRDLQRDLDRERRRQ